MSQTSRADDVRPDSPVPDSSRTARSGRTPVHLAQAALIALGIGVAVESRSLGLWTTLGPGPGLLPLVLGLALVVLTGTWTVQSLLERSRATGDADGDERAEPLDRSYIAVVLVSLLVLAAVIELIGFQIAMSAFLLLHLRWIGGQSWLVSLPVALIGTVGTFVLFDRVLAVPLPLSSLPMLSTWGL